MYMTDGDHPIADEMFLNFWWTEDKLAGDDLLAASATKAKNSASTRILCTPVSMCRPTADTPVKWNLFAGKDGRRIPLSACTARAGAYWSAGNPTTFRKNRESSMG
ncbi:MAG: hypothetical protein ACLT4Y_06435 [Bifidobacterium breve]